MLKTPEQYVESLRDGRVVYQDGEKIEGCTTICCHPFEAADTFFNCGCREILPCITRQYKPLNKPLNQKKVHQSGAAPI